MTRTALFSMATAVATLVITLGRGHADPAADRANIADAAVKLSLSAEALAKTARASEDRAVRKKVAPAATELGDDLSALARRARKDVPLDAIAKETHEIAKSAAALVELADEAEEKDERKALRAQASQLEAGVATLRTTIEVAAKAESKAESEKKKEKARPAAMAPDAFKRLLTAVEAADFDEGRIRVVSQAAESNHFTSNQVAAVLGVMDFDDGRVEAAAAMWDRIVDPENSFVIFEKFDFDGGREKLRRRIKR